MAKCNYPLNELANRKRWCPSESHTLKEQETAYMGLAFCSHHYLVMLARFPLGKPLAIPPAFHLTERKELETDE